MPHRLKVLRDNFKSRSATTSRKKSQPSLEKFIEERDYSGATTFLNYSDTNEVENLLWKGYCAFHNNDYESAQDIYINLLSSDDFKDNIPEETILFLACVYNSMHLYSEAYEAAQDGPDCALKRRIMYFLSHKLGKVDVEDFASTFPRGLVDDSLEDQMCKAAVLYSQYNFQEACEIYKRLLAEDRSRLALNYFIAMCYFKMDYYDVSLESLLVYQQSNDDSVAAKNLKASNSFRLYNGVAALDELKEMEDLEKVLSANDLLRHNMVAFTDGQNKVLQILSPLIDSIPEAKLNLALYHLLNDDIVEAHELLQDMEVVSPQENILLAVALTKYYQSLKDSKDNEHLLKEAKTYLHLVGTSPNDADTIPGRQCMAQYYFLQEQFDEVNVYLDSIRNYLSEDDDFNWNYGISLVATEDFATAEGILLSVQNVEYRNELCYVANICRALIMNGKPNKAWELKDSVKLDEDGMIFLLQVIGNDCYLTQKYLFAAKAFDYLNEINENESYIDALIASCIGAFKDVHLEIVQHKGSHNKYEVYSSTVSDIVTILEKYNGNDPIDHALTLINEWKRH